MKHTLYRTTNLINNKYYIGVHSTNNTDDNYFGSGIVLNKAIQKYGIENFKKEVLALFPSRKEAFEFEVILLEILLNDSNCYNAVGGGRGAYYGIRNPMHGKELSQEHKDKISERISGENHWAYGKKLSKEHVENLRNGQLNSKNHSTRGKKRPNFAKKMSGKNNPMYGNPTYGFQGKSHTKKSRERLRKANLGKTLSEETKEKMSKSRSKEYLHIETGKVYLGAKEIAPVLNLTIGQFRIEKMKGNLKEIIRTL